MFGNLPVSQQEGNDDDIILSGFIQVLINGGSWFVENVAVDGRSESIPEHKRVIPTCWWEKSTL